MLFLVLVAAVAAAQDPAPAIDSLSPGEGALTVKWSAPSGVTGITAYDLRWILTSADETVDANWRVVDDAWTAGPLQYVLTGLVNGSGYDVQVRAVKTSAGAWSATSAATPAEAGSTTATALALPLGVPLAATFGSADDVDWFEFSVTASTRLAVWTTGGVADTAAELTNSGGTTIASSDDAFLHTGELHMFIEAYVSAGSYYVKVRTKQGVGPYRLHSVSGLQEPGDSMAAAEALPLGEARVGRIDPPADVDYFKIDLAAAADVFLRATSPVVKGVGSTGSVNIDGALFDSAGDAVDAGIREQTFGGLGYRTYGFTMRERLAAGTYYLRVSRSSGGHVIGPYRVLAVEDTEQDELAAACSTGAEPTVTDPQYPCQWHLKNTGQAGGTAGAT